MKQITYYIASQNQHPVTVKHSKTANEGITQMIQSSVVRT